MQTKTGQNHKEHISELEIKGLHGRILRLPASQGNQRKILFIYGQHSSIERWWGLAQFFNQFGAVTMPDLPGFGGMDSLYKIGQPATIDNLADCLADFVSQEYQGKQVTIFAMSLGFVVVTRMLQRHPELVDRVDYLVSIVGFAHHSDFVFSRRKMLFYKVMSVVFSRRLPAAMFKATLLQPFVLRAVYHRTGNAREKFEAKSGDSFARTMDMEVELWAINDVRTQFKTYREMFWLDNTDRKINLPINHVAVKNDRYFNNSQVEQHMRHIFNDFEMFYADVPSHAPTVVADIGEAASFAPPALLKKVSLS